MLDNTMPEYKLKTKFIFFINMIIFIIISYFVIMFINSGKVNKMEKMVLHTHKVIYKTESLLGDLRDIETGQRGFLLTKDEKYLEPYFSGKIKSEQDLIELRALTSDNLSQQKRLDKLEMLVKEKFIEMESTIELFRVKSYDESIAIVKGDFGKELMDSIRNGISEFIGVEEILLRERQQTYTEYITKIKIFFIISIVLLLLSVLILYSVIQKSFVNKIDKLMEWAEASSDDKKLKNRIEKIFINSTDEIGVLANQLFKLSSKLNHNLAFYHSFQKAIEVGNMVSRSDLKGKITYVNDEFCNVTGYTREELIGKPHSIIRHPDTPQTVFEDLWKNIQSKKSWKGTIKNIKKDGNNYWINTNISPLLNEEGEIVEYIAIRHDITELVNQREEIQRVFETDRLTGYGNRLKLLEDIEDTKNSSLAISDINHIRELNDYYGDRFQLLDDIEKSTNPSLTLINIDNFRELNDFYGNLFGDKVIVELGKLIYNVVESEPQIKLYRIQGDEFAILNELMHKDNCVKTMNKLIHKVSKTDFLIDNEDISVEVTASISFEKRKELFTTADMAMKIAKKENKKFLVYHESLGLNKEYENNLKCTAQLKNAIKEDRLVPFYQPIVNNSNGKWEKYEALVRMIDDDGQIISPFFFLDIAKRTKNYIDLTKTVIQKTFETFKDGNVEFSINLTIQDIMDEGLKKFIFEKLQEFDNGKRVVFEIVESEGIENFDKVMEFIRSVKEYGCKIAIDDFGTGYSNFEYLLQLKADYIKIDGSMIKNIDKDEDAKIVVSTIVDFAKKMKIKTIAEFVENETIEAIVKDMGVDYCQGYHFSAPEPKPRSIIY